MSKPENTIRLQLDKANEILKHLAVNVSTDDRRAAMEELDIKARSTMIQYLKGEGKDLDTATSLVRFFKDRILSRERQLQDVA